MKHNKILLLFLMATFLMASVCACNGEKEVTQRKNLMMPKKSEMSRNTGHYKDVEKRPTNKNKLNKSKRKSLY
jgi:hypothetical protein